MARQVAKLNYLRIAPRKVRLVADLVRGLPVNEAEAQLLSFRGRAAGPILKLLRSAVANAKTNQKLEESKLYINSLQVDGGPMLKRFLPRARGRATEIQKKMSHVTIVLAEGKESRRFKIVAPKRSKLPKERGPMKKEKQYSEENKISNVKKPGFFKKLFNRKAGFAK